LDPSDSLDVDHVRSNITKLWGHSHNDEMHGQDAFVR
jgi:hypothetical protein